MIRVIYHLFEMTLVRDDHRQLLQMYDTSSKQFYTRCNFSKLY